ncbi:MAG: histidine--tRNA ligase, partial [Bacteroidetes bacterium RIFCSPHIGHO2_02_FULL_44_7]
TVPLARVIAQYQNDLPMPFKRYQIAPVWRADNPQKGRYREFYQCDVDVVGSDSLMADAEVMACLCKALEELGIMNYELRYNNRLSLEGFLQEKKQFSDIVREIDKVDKIGQDEVLKNLIKKNIPNAAVVKVRKLFALGRGDEASRIFEGYGSGFKLLKSFIVANGVNGDNVVFDPTLARGLDYYTGTIFEIVLPDAPQYGSIAGGGRYDNLVGMFSGKQIPAVGGSIGIDRLLSALEELEIIKYDLVSDVLVCNLDESLMEQYLNTAQQLREAGIKTDFYYETAKLDKQLKYADKKNINYAVIIGADEAKSGEATVKNLKTGKQERVKQKDLAKKLTK